MKTSIEAILFSFLVCSAVAAPDLPPQKPLGHMHGDKQASTDGLPFSTSALEEYIEAAMKRWHAPGMAVAVINGDETWAKVSDSMLPSSVVVPSIDTKPVAHSSQ